jgi:hypothetical protein
MLLALAQPAAAYIGVGAGMITTALGILAAVGLAIFAVVWYPIKRLLRRHSIRPCRVSPHLSGDRLRSSQ